MKYYFFYLEIALRDKNDLRIYAYENVSHIPTKKLIEIFRVDLNKDPHILDGYLLTKSSYKKHKAYLEKTIIPFDLNKFEYCLRQYVTDKKDQIRRLYKLSLME